MLLDCISVERLRVVLSGSMLGLRLIFLVSTLMGINLLISLLTSLLTRLSVVLTLTSISNMSRGRNMLLYSSVKRLLVMLRGSMLGFGLGYVIIAITLTNGGILNF